MRNRRRTWLLRRLVLGFAVAAMVAPAAQGALDEGGTVQSENTRSAFVTRGDDKTFAAVPAEGAIVVRGDDKVFEPAPSRIVAGDYGVLPAVPSDRVVNAGHYGILPAAGGDETILVGRPQGGFEAHPGGVEWSDGMIMGIAGLGLALAALLAFGAVRSTRRVGRPATA
jgi:hypothetical protein